MTQEEIKEYVYGKNEKQNYFYYVVSIEKDGKMYAWAERIDSCNNLLAINKRWQAQGALFVLPCKTYQYAKDVAAVWNDNFKQNGTYLFGNKPNYA